MTYDDIDAIYEISKNSLPESWSREAIGSEITNTRSKYLVYEKDSTVIGFIGAMTVLDEADILNIAIDSSMRGNGYGKELLSEMLSYLKQNNINIVNLEVRSSNKVALELYLSCGFVEIAVRKNYYSNPKEDARILQLDFLKV